MLELTDSSKNKKGIYTYPQSQFQKPLHGVVEEKCIMAPSIPFASKIRFYWRYIDDFIMICEDNQIEFPSFVQYLNHNTWGLSFPVITISLPQSFWMQSRQVTPRGSKHLRPSLKVLIAIAVSILIAGTTRHGCTIYVLDSLKG